MKTVINQIRQAANIALWGCGALGEQCFELLTVNLNLKVSTWVDSSPDNHGRELKQHWVIGNPEILLDKHDGVFVIVASENHEEPCTILEKAGYKFGESYSTYDALKKISHDLIGYLMNVFHKRIFFIFPPSLPSRQASPVEIALSQFGFYITPESRISWLRGSPPHVANAHKQLPYYSRKYIDNIFSGKNPIMRDGIFSQEEHASEFVNVIGGLRLTTDNPKNSFRNVHYFGPSHVYGFGVEDKFTIASCLQRLLNEKFPETFTVLNYGVRGEQFIDTLNKAVYTKIDSRDLVLIHLPHPEMWKNHDILAYNPGFCIDLDRFFQRPHPHGEVFYDPSHLNYHGTLVAAKVVASVLFPVILKEKTTLPLSTMGDEKKTANPEAVIASKEFEEYIQELKSYGAPSSFDEEPVIGSLVMNCNPFTSGHLFLVDLASKMVDRLYLFVVEEDKSIFPFKDRVQLVRNGTSELNNVIVLPSSRFIISNITFPEYFDKENKQTSTIDPSADVTIFGAAIAKALEITIRFAGEEPHDGITRQYNECMRRILPQYGIKFIEIPRKKSNGTPISASHVRKLLASGKLGDAKLLVPPTTYEYLVRNEKEIVSNLNNSRLNRVIRFLRG